MAEIPIPPAPNTQAYHKTPLRRYLNKVVVADLRQYMILPKTIAECQIAILHHLEKNSYLKAATPEDVVKNLKAEAVSHYKSSQMHLDLSDTSDLKGMLMLSSDSESVSSTGRFESEDDAEFGYGRRKPTKAELELESLRQEEEEIVRREQIVRKRKELEARRRKLEEDGK
jgi:hypothetical protein